MSLVLLQKLVKNTTLVSKHPQYYYYNIDNMTAEFTNINPIKDNSNSDNNYTLSFKYTFNNNTITLITNNIISDNIKHTFINNYTNEKYLKSHLIKCIRRTETYKAIKTAYHYMQLDIISFLKTLTVIAVEDSIPIQPGYSVAIWLLMASSNGYSLTTKDWHFLLWYTYELSESKNYISYPSVINRIIGKKSDIVNSIQYRKNFSTSKSESEILQLASSYYHNNEVIIKPCKLVSSYISIIRVCSLFCIYKYKQ